MGVLLGTEGWLGFFFTALGHRCSLESHVQSHYSTKRNASSGMHIPAGDRMSRILLCFQKAPDTVFLKTKHT